MGELGLNKIFGALLAVGLAVLGLRELSTIVFGGGHHAHYEYESLNAWAEKNFAYRVNIAESGAGGEVIEEVYDLGLLLASADIARGERSFRAKCATCHTIEEGGANGTGPNLYRSLFVPKQHVEGFNYSGALAAVGGEWTYEAMDDWLRAPGRYARGTSMAFAGLNRDDERANVIAYLTSYTPEAPAFPEPLPAVDEAVVESAEGDEAATDAAVIDAGAEAVDAVEAVIEEAVEPEAPTAETAIDAVVEDATEAAEATETSVIETVTDAVDEASDAADAAVEDITGDIVEDVTEAAEDAVEAPETGGEN
ncbi:MAG: c-type cytochrome [Henriciella sp.]|nr:c-type cytochrome [Henriciella sp.]